MGSDGRDIAVMEDLGAVLLGRGGVSGTLGVAGAGTVPLGVEDERPACGLVSLSGSAAKLLCSLHLAVPAQTMQASYVNLKTGNLEACTPCLDAIL